MKPREADKAIKSGEAVTLHNAQHDETWEAVIVSRDRYTFSTADGGVFERDDVEIVQPSK